MGLSFTRWLRLIGSAYAGMPRLTSGTASGNAPWLHEKGRCLSRCEFRARVCLPDSPGDACHLCANTVVVSALLSQWLTGSYGRLQDE
jgi:hypothetical protein